MGWVLRSGRWLRPGRRAAWKALWRCRIPATDFVLSQRITAGLPQIGHSNSVNMWRILAIVVVLPGVLYVLGPRVAAWRVPCGGRPPGSGDAADGDRPGSSIGQTGCRVGVHVCRMLAVAVPALAA